MLLEPCTRKTGYRGAESARFSWLAGAFCEPAGRPLRHQNHSGPPWAQQTVHHGGLYL